MNEASFVPFKKITNGWYGAQTEFKKMITRKWFKNLRKLGLIHLGGTDDHGASSSGRLRCQRLGRRRRKPETRYH